MQRFNRLAEGGSGGAGLGAYDTLELVEGSENVEPLTTRIAATLTSEAMAEAREYTESRNSSAFLLWRDGVLEAESYFGDFDRDSLLVSKSLAKPITAILIGRALQQGHLRSLDQPVADIITEWQGDPQRSEILIRHLLDMRTGFKPQGFAPDPTDVLNRAYLHPRHDEVIINDYPLTHEPGTRYEYANATSEMVAPLLERATGMRYGDYLSEALLKPLGAAGGQIWVNRPGGTAHSGCCVLLPAQTFLRLGVLLLQDGEWEGQRLLPEGYVAEMREGTIENPYYGLGVWLPHTYIERRGFAHPSVPFGKVLHSEPYADKDIFLFDGNGNQVVYMIPSANMVILRMGGRPPKDAEWDNAFLPNLLLRDANRDPATIMPEPQPR
ncbi:serine hydrolase domain-containing protein [Erythrobacter sp. W53]|uniref:serine hydrolase domain-containing protein n=1 Tax=Erythrobacter sp. W53 TaxID=3425947 RepID=UPI003D76A17A